jgi:hypothetical protein
MGYGERMGEKQKQVMKALNHFLDKLNTEYDTTPDNHLIAKIYIQGKVEALEFAIEHFGNLERIENRLLIATESLYMQKERMDEYASPRIASEGFIDGLLEAKNLIEQTNNE